MKLIFYLIIVVYSRSCIHFEGQICIDSLPITLQRSALPDIIGSWSFDKVQIGMDQSQFGNDMSGLPAIGPGYAGNGHSAYFNADSYGTIQHLEEYNLQQVSYLLWIFPLSSSPQFTSIFRKGGDSNEYTPTIMLWPTSDEANVGGGQLEVVLSTSQGKWSCKSFGMLPGRRWTHLALVISFNVVSLYVNGYLEFSKSLSEMPMMNNGPIYVGGDPWYPGPIMYIDEFKIFGKSLLENEINKLSYQPGRLNVRSLKLGCDSCSYHQAVTSCGQGWHLCSKYEINANSYQLLRVQGWIRAAMDIWGRVDEMNEQLVKDYLNPQTSKSALCCLNQFY